MVLSPMKCFILFCENFAWDGGKKKSAGRWHCLSTCSPHTHTHSLKNVLSHGVAGEKDGKTAWLHALH